MLSFCHNDIGLKLPWFGTHRTKPIVEEGHETNLIETVLNAVDEIVGIRHDQQVIAGVLWLS